MPTVNAKTISDCKQKRRTEAQAQNDPSDLQYSLICHSNVAESLLL